MAATKTTPSQSPVSVAGLQVLENEPMLSTRLNIRFTRQQYEDLQRVASLARVPVATAARRLVTLAAADLLSQAEA